MLFHFTFANYVLHLQGYVNLHYRESQKKQAPKTTNKYGLCFR